MPALVDTTLRLLGQEPLASVLPTAAQLDLAEILDTAGFAYLEVSGGGCFDTAVKRGVESPWERIRALKARTETPLAMALRGRFLVGSRPVGGDFVRRFVASAAESGIDVFRLHDPLNDVSNLREASEAITAAGREFDAGLVYSPGPAGETDTLVAQAQRLPELGAARVLIHDPSGSLEPHRMRELVEAIREASGLPVGLYCQGAGGTALATPIEGARAGADLIASAVYPVALVLHRASGEAIAGALDGLGLRDRRRHRRALARLRPRRRAHQRPAGRAAPAADRDPRRRAQPSARPRRRARRPPARALAGRPARRGDRRARADPRRGRLAAARGADRPGARLAGAPARAGLRALPGRRRRAPRPAPGALRHAARARSTPAVQRAVELVSDGAEPEREPDLDELRKRYAGIAASEEELLLVALFGEDAEPLLRTIRGRGSQESLEGSGVEASRAERIREIVRIVQDSGVGEVTIEDAGLRVTVRRTPEPAEGLVAAPRPAVEEEETTAAAPAAPPVDPGVIRVEAPMVGTFYRAPSPGADAVRPGGRHGRRSARRSASSRR